MTVKSPRWRDAPLSALIQQPVSGVSVLATDDPPSPGNPGILKLSCVSGGRFDPSDLKTPIPSEVHRLTAFAEADTIIISRSNTPELVGASAYVARDKSTAFLPDTLWTLRRKHQEVSMRWLSFALQSNWCSIAIRSSAHGTSDSMKKIQKGSFLKIVIKTPPLPEQQKIADILSAWDEALEKLDALIVAKDRRKKALMQQLLTGKRRLPGAKAWKRVLLADVAEECGERNRETLDRSRLFAVTKAAGMVPMRENVQGATINRCKLVERGWFAYNPMRLNIGSIARWEGTAPVMVSPDYVVFRTKEDRLLSDYLNHVRQAAPWADFVSASGNGSVRVRIWFDDLGRFKLPLPSLPEQRAIADLLNAADTELRLLRQQRAALDQQKRGLMQQLLTGRKRVKTA